MLVTHFLHVCAVPIFSENDQPMYGAGKKLEPVYTETLEEASPNKTCFLPAEEPFTPEFCKVSVRNSPYEGWKPAFVVWPLSAQHVAEAIKFARKHNLCVMVTGVCCVCVCVYVCDHCVYLCTYAALCPSPPPPLPVFALPLRPPLSFCV